MFIIWSTYWIWSIIDIHLRSKATGTHAYLPVHTSARPSSNNKGSNDSTTSSNGSSKHRSMGRGQPFRSRPWYPWPYWPAPHLEPIIKVLLSLVGVLIELYIGWGGWRPLYKPDGHFAEFHANNWQHALMYTGFAVSGLVDITGHYMALPPGTEQAFLSIAFLVETLLMGTHAKPNPLDQLVHLLLTWVMVACIVVTAAEVAAPRSLLLAVLRAMLVFFQGTWFWHVGSIMFRNHMAWDMDDMASVMFVPVVFSLHILLICFGTFTVYLFMRWLYTKWSICPGNWSGQQIANGNFGDLDNLLDAQLELTGFSTDIRDQNTRKGANVTERN
eukprot:GHRR01033037.1.p1 GENE.GHRR01033037.1~~GHRR01033037.1.p1  ORF type:complete len:330 (+),score=109.70 GHRR01033037.1:93-1082(+)